MTGTVDRADDFLFFEAEDVFTSLFKECLSKVKSL